MITRRVDDPEAALGEVRGALVAPGSAGHGAWADDRDLDCAVAALYAALPDKQRASLMLRLKHNLEYAEIAPILRCSVGEARATVYAVLRSLREDLGDRL